MQTEDTNAQIADKKTAEHPEAIVTRWLKELDTVKNSKSQKNFERIGEQVVKNYRNHSALQDYSRATPAPSRVMFNILWSNVQVLSPSLYARLPKVVVERRFKDSDPVGRLASRMAERATHFMISTQQDRANCAFRGAVMDRLLPGRGITWLRYDADFHKVQAEDGSEVDAIKPNSEKILIDPVCWEDYFHSAARNPFEIRWMARRVYMTREKLVQRFGEEIGRQVELTFSPEGISKKSRDDNTDAQYLKQAEVYEIWDSESKKVFWISEGLKEQPLDVKDDPYRLDDFWPCPMPLLATTTTDSMYPTADFKIYERLADELDYVTKRLAAMADCVRLVGICAASLNTEIVNMLKLQDGQLKPSEQWGSFAEKGGLRGVIDWMPFDQCVAAIQPLMAYQANLLAQINEITGMPDIVRGSSDPNDPVYTQQAKQHWTVIKLTEKQQEVQRFCRQTISKVAELIFEPGLFSDETIYLMCGFDQLSPEDQQLYPQALALLRNDRLRTFRVDIETDSTIALDEDQNIQRWMNYMQTVQQVVGEVQNITQFRPELMKPIVQSALAAVRTLRTGRQVEGAWEQAFDSIEQNDKAAAERAAQSPPPPDYEMLKLQNEAQRIQLQNQEMLTKQQQAGFEIQFKQNTEAFDQWIETEKFKLESQTQQMNFNLESQKIQIEAIKTGNKQEIEKTYQTLEAFKTEFMQAMEAQKIEIEKYRVVLDQKEKFLEEARLQQQMLQENVKALQETPKESATQPPPVIHIHNSGAKAITLKRSPTGELIGESKPISDEVRP